MTGPMRTWVVAIPVSVLLTGCGDSRQAQIEENFAGCIEEGGGTVGDSFEAILASNGPLVAIAGDVDADEALFRRCFDAAARW